MGLLDALRLSAAVIPPAQTPDVVAALDSYTFPHYPMGLFPSFDSTEYVNRRDAMSVPAVARARNILCGVIGSLPLERYSGLTGQQLASQPLFYQPDRSSPRSVTYAWLADSILFYGVGYLQVTETYAEDGRPARARWIDPLRVTVQTDPTGTMVTGYALDAAALPSSGVGSLIAFPATEEGLLNRAGRTIRTAIELESAAKRAAEEPTPQTVISSTGVDLPEHKVTDLMTKWKQARRTKATAYLYSGLKLDTVGFDPKAQQLVEARQFTASEIARAVSIPAWYLNAETASMTYSNTEQERRTLIDFSLRPILSAIEDRLSMEDVSARSVMVRFSLDDFLRGSAMERVDITLKLLDAGLITLDQAKAREDLSPDGSES